MPKGRFRSLRDPETLERLVRRLPAAVYITNDKGEILDANPACVRLFGSRSLEELRQHKAQEFFLAPEDRSQQIEVLESTGAMREHEIGLRREDGEVRTVLDACYAVRDPDTGRFLFHGVLIDITDRKKLERQLRELSVRDALTGCFNRRRLEELEEELDDDARWGAVVVDIDHFKRINDREGHEEGDRVLVKVASYLNRRVRAHDCVVRLGGDEFLVLLLDDAAERTESIAFRLTEGKGGPPTPITLGWAVRKGRESLEETIGRADRRLLAVRRKERVKERRRSGSYGSVPVG